MIYVRAIGILTFVAWFIDVIRGIGNHHTDRALCGPWIIGWVNCLDAADRSIREMREWGSRVASVDSGVCCIRRRIGWDARNVFSVLSLKFSKIPANGMYHWCRYTDKNKTLE